VVIDCNCDCDSESMIHAKVTSNTSQLNRFVAL
jgi:hypothetical protein